MALVAAAALAAPAEARRNPPNIVLITTDDQPLSTFTREAMPRTFRRLVDRGTSFEDAIVNVPLCCPSRATLLTGQYPHNHGVLTNLPGYGALESPRNVLPVWMRRAGYRTAHFGKWLHGYEKVRGAKVAPGWGEWLTQLNRRRYYDYKLSKNGETIRKGTRTKDHLTPVMTHAASKFLKRNLEGRRPVFMQLDYYAPHVGPRYSDPGAGPSRCIGAPEPSPRDRRTITEGGAPRGPAFNEADNSDKPDFARVGLLDARALQGLDRKYRCTLESLAGVDRGINRVFQRFQRAGELKNTAFIFMTDNGYFFGEHRIPVGKARPWEEAVRTPLILRLPAKLAARTQPTVSAQVGSIDVAPTIVHLAGAQPCRDTCRTLDGRSLLAPARGRTDAFENRALLIEMADSARERRTFACRFQALRTGGDILIENTSVPDPGSRQCEDRLVYEYYDLAADPFQLENRIGPGAMPVTPRQLAHRDRLDGLRACSGLRGRDPVTPGGFCE